MDRNKLAILKHLKERLSLLKESQKQDAIWDEYEESQTRDKTTETTEGKIRVANRDFKDAKEEING